VAAGFGGAVKNLNVNGTDMPSVQATITAKLQQDPAFDYVMTLGAPIALTATEAVGNAGSTAGIATFDTNAAFVDTIKNGKVQWAVDQQPFLQTTWRSIHSGFLRLVEIDEMAGFTRTNSPVRVPGRKMGGRR